jgi:hypothetical protein
MGCSDSDTDPPAGEQRPVPRAHQQAHAPSAPNAGRDVALIRFTEEACEKDQKTVVSKYKISWFPRIIPDEFIGEGIKRTPAYETNLTKEQIIEKRKSFWSKYSPKNV